MGRIIEIQALETRIKRRLRAHLKELGFVKAKNGLFLPNQQTKDHFRGLHRIQRKDKLQNGTKFVEENWLTLSKYFADGRKIAPKRIVPRIQVVESGTIESNLFRLACLTWSVPVSQGYGRRMRFLVWDEYHEKLMGIFALGDPVFNLKVRDEFIGWNQEDRKKRLVNMMDAYILGALPPYNMILCGKLVASIIRTTEVRASFARKYSDTRGIISEKKKRPSLAMVSTSSSLGRSSVYNRLKLGGIQYFRSLGFTSGWGHFHIPDSLFEDMRHYLKKKGHRYAANHQFGDGPNWRLRTIRACLDMIGMNSDLLKHGICREVLVCRLAVNAERFLRGEVSRPYCRDLLSVEEVAELAKERWVLPRAKRRGEFRDWEAGRIRQLVDPNKSGDASLIRGPRACRKKVSGE